MVSLQVLRTMMGRIGVFTDYSGLISCLIVSMLFAGCSASSLDSTREAGGRKTLSAVELDVLTASGDSDQVTVVDPSAVPNGSEARTPGLSNPQGPLYSSPDVSSAQFPAVQTLTVPNVTQFNSIHQVR